MLFDDRTLGTLMVFCGLLALVGAIIAAAATLLLTGMREIRANGVGLVDGMGDEEALSPWLHRKINELAGTTGGVLTFADLWGVEDDAAKRRLERNRSGRRVNLELMTTNLSESRPQRQPLSAPDYFYDPGELARLFPKDVVDLGAATHHRQGGTVLLDPRENQAKRLSFDLLHILGRDWLSVLDRTGHQSIRCRRPGSSPGQDVAGHAQ